MVIEVDFEIYSELDVTKVGLWNYTHHPSTDIICMAYRMEGQITKLWRPGRKVPQFPPGWILRAHNSAFEYAILEDIGIGYGLTLPSDQICTATQAAVMTYPRSLEKVSKAMMLPLQKDTEGRGHMLQVTKPRKPSLKNPDTNWFRDKKRMNSVYRYCIQDVNVEEYVAKRTHPLTKYEKHLFDLNNTINKRGIHFDRELAEAALDIADQAMLVADDEMYELTNFKVRGIQKTKALTTYIREQNVECESIAKDALTELLNTDLPDHVRVILLLRQKMSKTSVAKYQKMLLWGSKDDRLHNLFMHHGAGTGRWTGKGPQLHNLPQGTKFELPKEGIIELIKTRDATVLAEHANPMDALSSCIRETMTATPGNILAAADFKGIEVRVLAWVAKQMDLLSQLTKGADPYIYMATNIYSVKEQDVIAEQRNVGKMAILGLGYGMGPTAFQDQCTKRGIEITKEFAQGIVKKYRQTYRKVTKFWRNIEATAIQAVKEPHDCHFCENLTFYMRGRNLVMMLPNGRSLYYIEPQLSNPFTGKPTLSHMHVNSYTKQWERRDTYGGMLTENAVQAIARDLLAEAMLRVEPYYPIVIHIHDELVSDVNPKNFDRKHFESLVRVVPKWATGIPIEIDTWYQYRYQKG